MSDKPCRGERYGRGVLASAPSGMARRRLRLGFKLRSPVAERLERNPLGLAILPLIQLAPTLLVTVLSHSLGHKTCGSPGARR